MAGVLYRTGTAFISRAHGYTLGFVGVQVANLFQIYVWCCGFILSPLLSLVLPIARLYIIDFPFGFAERLFKTFSHIVELGDVFLPPAGHGNICSFSLFCACSFR